MTQTPPANGNTPHPTPMDTSQLSDFDRAVAERFAQDNAIPEPSVPGTPAPDNQGQVPDNTPLQAGGGEGVSPPPGSVATGQEGTTPTTPQDFGLPEGIDWNDIAPEYKVGNRSLPFDEAVKALQAYDWAQGLSPDQTNAIDGVLNGQFLLVPRDQAAEIERMYQERWQAEQQAQLQGQAPVPGQFPPATPTVPGQVQPQSSPTVPVPPPSFNPDDYADPKLAQEMHIYMQGMQAQLQALQQPLQQVQLTQEELQMQQAEARMNIGAEAFQTAYELDDQAMLTIRQAFANSQTFTAYLQQYGGDYTKAVQAGLEATYWQIPEFRQQAIAKQAQAQAQVNQAAHEQQQQVMQQQASLTGAGGSVSRNETPPDPRTLSGQQRTTALAAAIEKAQKEGTWSAEHLG